MVPALHRCVLVVPILFQLFQQAAAQEFRVDTVASAPQIASPAAIAFVPGNSGRFFFAEKSSGRVRAVDERGVLDPVPFVTLAVTPGGEQGLLGIDVHPSYPDSPFVYLFFTRSNSRGGKRDNMIVRFRDSLGRGIHPDTILIVRRVNAATNNNGGSIHFGPDGMLYVSVGDNAVAANAQDSTASNPRGKILRLYPDGSLPDDNPFAGTPFWSIGHRNSYDFTFDAATGQMYCTENGPGCSDEIDRVPPRGNMGWPLEGNCTYEDDDACVRPLVVFPAAPLPSLTGIAVYRGAAFPRMNGQLLFTGSNTSSLWSLTLTASGDSVIPGSMAALFTSTGGFADVAVAPDGAIYLTGGPNSPGGILRLNAVEPLFTSPPLRSATQDQRYLYAPSFSGTAPAIRLLTAPEGMLVDSASWSVVWTPTNEQALEEHQTVTIRAENGGGYSDQSFVIAVANVNDAPLPFELAGPPGDTVLTFTNADPHVTFTWDVAFDPDRDTLDYTVQIDTAMTFSTPALMNLSAGAGTSLTALLPRRSGIYFWRVRVSDGEVSVASTGVRSLLVTVLTAAAEDGPVKNRESLEQNFPNPFNPSTSIKYTIPRGGWVRLAVFNLLGQEVALIFEGEQEAGTYEVSFAKANLPTGIYFYRIQAPGFIETRKMTITK